MALIFTSDKTACATDAINARLSTTTISFIGIQLTAFSHAQVHHVVFLLPFRGSKQQWREGRNFRFFSFRSATLQQETCVLPRPPTTTHQHSTSNMYNTLFMMENMKVSIFCLKVAAMNKKWNAFSSFLRALRRSKLPTEGKVHVGIRKLTGSRFLAATRIEEWLIWSSVIKTGNETLFVYVGRRWGRDWRVRGWRLIPWRGGEGEDGVSEHEEAFTSNNTRQLPCVLGSNKGA